MKLELDETASSYTVSSYGSGYIEVANRRINRTCLLTQDRIVTDLLPESLTSITPHHIAQCIELEPEVVIFGTGNTQIFPDHLLVQPLLDAGIGYEIMNTAAACRCYNVLIAENRRTVALLFIAEPHA